MVVLQDKAVVVVGHLNNRLFISIIVPVLNESQGIESFLEKLEWVRLLGHEVIVADGGSQDETIEKAKPFCDKLIVSTPGRARQMNAGASKASGNLLLFLHADTVLPKNFITELAAFMSSTQCWGRFDVRLSGRHPMLRVVERMMNWRSRLTGIATGDQAIFIKAAVFHQLNGFPDQPLMEDVEMSKRLKKIGRPFCISSPLTTSSRRWDTHGVWRTIWLMWKLRYQYNKGVSAREIHRQYYPK